MWLTNAFAAAAVPAAFVALSEGASAAAAVPAEAAAAAKLELGFMGLRPLEKSPNAVFSPLSILSVLALAAQGASGECKAALDGLLGDSNNTSSKRMRAALLQGGDYLAADELWLRNLEAWSRETGEPMPVLDVLSRLYVDSQVEAQPAFQQFKEDLLRAQVPSSAVRAADFSKAEETAAEMNAAVAAATRGKIDSLVTPSSVRASRFVPLNAVYFNSDWMSHFKTGKTFPGVFNAVAKGGRRKRKEVQFMHRVFKPGTIGYAEADGVQVVGLQYVYPGAWLFLYKPEDPEAFVQKYYSSPSSLANLVSTARQALSREFNTVNVSLPKFHLTASNHKFDAAELLQSMGLGACMRPCSAPESSEQEGDSNDKGCVGAFDRVGGEGSSLFFSAMNHQADISVTERGTEAAAATAGVVTYSGSLRKKANKAVIFDSPFFFELRVQAGLFYPAIEDFIVFSGRVGDPSKH
ncbi:hypothetical protein Emed_005645 [Eimeria media]